jgi:hypothetical protein
VPRSSDFEGGRTGRCGFHLLTCGYMIPPPVLTQRTRLRSLADGLAESSTRPSPVGVWRARIRQQDGKRARHGRRQPGPGRAERITVDTANRLQGREYEVVVVANPLSGRRDATTFSPRRGTPSRPHQTPPPRLHRRQPRRHHRPTRRTPAHRSHSPQLSRQIPRRMRSPPHRPSPPQPRPHHRLKLGRLRLQVGGAYALG